MSTELTIPKTISDLLKIREKIIAAWNKANDAVDSVESAFAEIDDDSFHFYPEQYKRDKCGVKYDVDDLTPDLDYALFEFVFKKIGLTKIMTEKNISDFLAKVKAEKTVFCADQLQGLAQNSERMFKENSLDTVRQVYRGLIGCRYHGGNWGHGKRDNLQKVEKVFRISGCDLGINPINGKAEWTAWKYSVNSALRVFHFNDLLRACRLIEGAGFVDYSNDINAAIQKSVGKIVETEYFACQIYKNGNVKVKWNPNKYGVLDKLNLIGSGKSNSLGDVMRKRYKKEHFDGLSNAVDYFKMSEAPEPSPNRDYNFFETPSDIAQRMTNLLQADDGYTKSILEPSCGTGEIYKFLPAVNHIICIEYTRERCEKFYEKFRWRPIQCDFLKYEPNHLHDFDRVIMNPPFGEGSGRAEAWHVIKAWGLLRPEGMMVALLPESWFFREDMASRVLRKFLSDNQWQEPESVEVRGIKCRIVVLRKE